MHKGTHWARDFGLSRDKRRPRFLPAGGPIKERVSINLKHSAERAVRLAKLLFARSREPEARPAGAGLSEEGSESVVCGEPDRLKIRQRIPGVLKREWLRLRLGGLGVHEEVEGWSWFEFKFWG